MEKKSVLIIRKSLYELMTTLIYPAILGSILFLVLSTVFSKSYNFFSIQFLFTTFMLFNFIITFLNTVMLRYEKAEFPFLSYSWFPFVIDIIEVCVLFAIFINLGYKFSTESDSVLDLKTVYLIYGLLQILHPIWAKLTKYDPDPILILTQLIRFLFCMIGFLVLFNSDVFNCITIGFFYFLIILSLFFDNGFDPQWKKDFLKKPIMKKFENILERVLAKSL